MENNSDWKLRLRYGKDKTPYTHFTVLGDGTVVDNSHGFDCPVGPAVMAIKVWALDSEQACNMLNVIGEQVGFHVKGKVEIYKTEPEEPPKENPFGYGINFTPYRE